MAKNRIINTKFWTDPFVLDGLNPIDKLVFLYLLTNPYTDISGVYELPIKVMATETGVDRDNIERVILPRFEEAGKILYRNGWIGIKNFIKHQSLNPKVERGIQIGLSRAPKELQEFIGYAMDSLSHPKSNLNPKNRVLETKTPTSVSSGEEVTTDYNVDSEGQDRPPTPKKQGSKRSGAADRVSAYYNKKAREYTGKPVMGYAYSIVKKLIEQKKLTEKFLMEVVDEFFEMMPPDDKAVNPFICFSQQSINRKLLS